MKVLILFLLTLGILNNTESYKVKFNTKINGNLKKSKVILFDNVNNDDNPIHTDTNNIIENEVIESDDKDKSDFIKDVFNKINFPNLLVGSLLGVVTTISLLFIPYENFLSNEQSQSFNAVETAIEKIQPQISLFSDILYDLETGYVDNISPSKLFETAVTAMLKTLDPYTEYENFGQARSMQESVSGKYGGVGLVIANAKDSTAKKIIDKNQNFNKIDETNAVRVPDIINGVSVADAFEGYAYDAGMRIGDHIISVNDVDTRNMNVEQVRDLLRGDPYTYVKVKFERDEGLSPNTADSTTNPKTSILEATLKRNLVKISDVRLATFLGDPSDGIGYINLSGFNAASAKDFRTAFLMLRFSSAHDLKSLILDLRGNPGGLLDAAIEIASYLVPAKSNIVTSKSKDGTEITYRSTIDPIRPPGMKLAVLVNGGSASAAEIVAGAIQDLDAGIIVGSSKTYGKGLVQKVAPLPYDSALKYTVARYYTPSGRCIQATKYSGGRDDFKTIINDGAEVISESDRKTFFTLGGRPVRDGGGIEPDITIPNIKPSLSESLLLSQGIFSDYITDFLKSSDIRSQLHEIVNEEQVMRLQDPRLIGVININSMSQYLVLNPLVTSIKSDETLNKYINNNQVNNYEKITNVLNNPLDLTTRYVNHDKLYGNFRKYVETLINNEKLNFDNTNIGNLLNSLSKLVSNEDNQLVGSSYYKNINYNIDNIKENIKKNIIYDMDLHKDDIIDEIELALLSREFPNRLLFYRNIMRDPQVKNVINILNSNDPLVK